MGNLEKIEQLRARLTIAYLQHRNFTNPKVLSLSQALDREIVKYQQELITYKKMPK